MKSYVFETHPNGCKEHFKKCQNLDSVEKSENANTFTSYPSQEKCSQKLVDIVRDKIGTENLKKFQYFDVFFFVPIYLSLYDQTVKRFSSFIDHFQVNTRPISRLLFGGF